MRRLFVRLFTQSSAPPIEAPAEPDPILYYLANLSEVEGWGLDPELAFIFLNLSSEQERLGVTGNLFEIGVHHGRTAILLALMARPGEVSIFLDLFERQDENIDASGRGDLKTFKANLARWAPNAAVEIIVANSLSFDFATSPGLCHGVRFAHIDGGHYTELVLNDLCKTEAALRPGGLIVVDDFLHPGFPGVNEACNLYLQRAHGQGLAPIATGKNKLILTTRGHAAAYTAMLKATLAPPRGKTVRFYGNDVICCDPF